MNHTDIAVIENCNNYSINDTNNVSKMWNINNIWTKENKLSNRRCLLVRLQTHCRSFENVELDFSETSLKGFFGEHTTYGYTTFFLFQYSLYHVSTVLLFPWRLSSYSPFNWSNIVNSSIILHIFVVASKIYKHISDSTNSCVLIKFLLKFYPIINFDNLKI